MNTIKRGRLYDFNNDYGIYELYSPKGIKYYLCMSNNDVNDYTFYVGFPTKDVNYQAAYEIKNEITMIFDMLYQLNPGSVYLFCEIDYQRLEEAANDNDNLLYNLLLNDVHDITKDAYALFNEVNVEQTLYFIKQSNADTKFINWIDLKLDGFIDIIKINDIKRKINKLKDDNTVEITFSNNQQITNLDNNIVKAPSYGFMNITFIGSILLLSIVLGIYIAIILIK